MPKFLYQAKRSPGETIQGVLEAEDRSNAIALLTERGCLPIQVEEVTEEDRKSQLLTDKEGQEVRVPPRALHQFTRQFASLIRSHVPVLRALGILSEQATHPKMRQVVEALAEAIRQGQTLSEAMGRFPKVFFPLYICLIRSGEVGGMLDVVLEQLAVQADREEAFESKMRSSLAYPLFVLAVGCFTVAFLFLFVIPRLTKLFQVFGANLPWPTRWTLFVVQNVSCHWYGYLGGLALVGLVGMWLMRGRMGRKSMDLLLLKVPYLRDILRDMEIVRFARSFGLLLAHGVPILQAADVAIPLVRSLPLRKELERLPAHLKEGHTLSGGLKGLSISTALLVNTVAVGEESGRVPEALSEVAHFYEREVERRLQILTALLEPAILLGIGGVVGWIVLAILLPILTMSTVIR
jgi:type II secretory pathway component PulF